MWIKFYSRPWYKSDNCAWVGTEELRFDNTLITNFVILYKINIIDKDTHSGNNKNKSYMYLNINEN